VFALVCAWALFHAVRVRRLALFLVALCVLVGRLSLADSLLISGVCVFSPFNLSCVRLCLSCRVSVQSRRKAKQAGEGGDLQRIFDTFDNDDDGIISTAELGVAIRASGTFAGLCVCVWARVCVCVFLLCCVCSIRAVP
jgi:EF-hand domain